MNHENSFTNLPKDWSVVTFGEVMDIQGGSQPPKNTFKNEPEENYIRLLQIRDFGKKPVPTYVPKDRVTKFCEKEDIFIARYGASLGRILTGMEGAYNVALAKVLYDRNLFEKGYLFYILKTPIFQTPIKMISRSAQNGFNKSDLYPIKIPVAPYEQQKRIVAKIEELFSHVDAGIASLKQAKKLLKQYRQSVLKAAVTGELTKQWREENKGKLEPASQLLERIVTERTAEYLKKVTDWEATLSKWKQDGATGKKPSKPHKLKSMSEISDDLGPLPYGWTWLKLGDLAVDVFDGPFGSNLKSSDYVEEGVRVIRLENIGSLEFKNDKLTYVTQEKYASLKRHTVASGDIIFSSFVADGTRVVVLPENIDRAINKADCFCIRSFGSSMDANYLANFLSTTATYKRLENLVHGATRPRINTTQLKDLEIPVCSETEQAEIVRLVRDKFDSIRRLENEIDIQLLKSDKNKRSILASAFAGQLS